MTKTGTAGDQPIGAEAGAGYEKVICEKNAPQEQVQGARSIGPDEGERADEFGRVHWPGAFKITVRPCTALCPVPTDSAALY